MTLTAILAVSDDNIIGVEGPRGPKLPWNLPPDMRRFKELTTGHTVIMGRKTFESIGKPLPNRTNVVVTRNLALGLAHKIIACNSPERALWDAGQEDPNPFLIGGAELYAALWPMVSRVELTEVHTTVGLGTAFGIDRSKWRETKREGGEHCGLRFDFVTLEREALPIEGARP